MTTTERVAAGRVLLLSLPFSALFYPSLALSLLKPAIEATGIGCDIRYLHLEFADKIGAATHDLITSPSLYQAMAGEWVFSPHAKITPAASLDDDMAYFSDVIGAHFSRFFTPDNLRALLLAREEADAFLDAACAAIDVDAYDVVGFTSSFQQNAASLGLARMLKRRRPDLVIVFGGANCRAELGAELLRRYDFIDAVCTGEGDRCFADFVTRVACEGKVPHDVGGMLTRLTPPSVGEGEVLNDLDALPTPDFSDFFAQHAATAVAHRNYPPVALFETSRGCWWGAKHHCTFCGINGKSMAYRRKSADGAMREIERLIGLYGTDLVNVDTILDTRYFETLLPRLAELPEPITAYYEMKANLRPDQFVLLQRAGILKIQPGIESLDNHILSTMRKGCTAIQNVQTLKLAAEQGLYVEWNFLTGFPGERTEHYEGMARLIPKLMHLQPPAGVGQVRADRFSPYYERPGEFGVTVSPSPAYRFIYPPSDGDVALMSYHFLIDGRTAADEATVRLTESQCRAWKAEVGRHALGVRERADGGCDVVRVRDGRAAEVVKLDDDQGAVLARAWTITTPARIATGTGLSEARLCAAVEALDAAGLLMRDGEQILALPLRRASGMAPTWTQVRHEAALARGALARAA